MFVSLFLSCRGMYPPSHVHAQFPNVCEAFVPDCERRALSGLLSRGPSLHFGRSLWLGTAGSYSWESSIHVSIVPGPSVPDPSRLWVVAANTIWHGMAGMAWVGFLHWPGGRLVKTVAVAVIRYNGGVDWCGILFAAGHGGVL
eukprot:jgi/Mesvir1/17138/Mv26412-RA.1